MLAVAAVAAPGALADKTGDYIVADDAATPAVYDFTPAGTRTTITSAGSLVNPEGLVRLGADDYLVADKGPVAGNNTTLDGLVVRVRNGTQSVLASAGNLINPHGIALSADRKTAYVAGRDGRIVAITIATGAQRLVATLTADLRGIAVEKAGTLLVVDNNPPTKLIRVDASTGAQTTLVSGTPPAFDLRSVMVEPNGDVVLGDQGTTTANGAILEGPPGGPLATVAGGAFFAQQSVPGALALDTKGDVIVADRNNAAVGGGPGRIYRVSLKGAITPIVADTTALLSEPGGLAIVPPKCGGKFATIVGTPGKDKLVGTNGADVVVALGGNDTVKVKGGKDVVCGGAGNDTISGGAGKDTLIPGKGADRVNSGPGNDVLKCSPLDPRCG